MGLQGGRVSKNIGVINLKNKHVLIASLISASPIDIGVSISCGVKGDGRNVPVVFMYTWNSILCLACAATYIDIWVAWSEHPQITSGSGIHK